MNSLFSAIIGSIVSNLISLFTSFVKRLQRYNKVKAKVKEVDKKSDPVRAMVKENDQEIEEIAKIKNPVVRRKKRKTRRKKRSKLLREVSKL